MLKQIFNEEELPVGELNRLGLAEGSKIALNEDDIKALLSGRRTEMLRLENISGDGVTIPALDAKLSLKPNVNGGLDLLVHPIYRKADFPDYLTDNEAEALETGNAVNIEKNIMDKQGRKKTVLVEFDKDTREFIVTDTERVLAPDMLNNELLSPEQKDRYRKGKEVKLADGTTFQFSGTESKAICANKLALIASVIVDGGLTYVLYKGLNALFGQKHDKETSKDYGKGYHTDLEKLQEQEQVRRTVLSNHYDGDHHRGYSRGASR